MRLRFAYNASSRVGSIVCFVTLPQSPCIHAVFVVPLISRLGGYLRFYDIERIDESLRLGCQWITLLSPHTDLRPMTSGTVSSR